MIHKMNLWSRAAVSGLSLLPSHVLLIAVQIIMTVGAKPIDATAERHLVHR